MAGPRSRCLRGKLCAPTTGWPHAYGALQAFTIYTFFQLLINFLGGERALIIMTHGRPPIQHAWPLNHILPKVDISDPQTFLAVKRGILQYTWLKPILAIISIVMKATDTYQEGYLGLTSGYLWTGIVYNVSVTISLYSLAMFWVCLHNDLAPFRPVPKFLCVKLIIFASYWQGFFLSILQWLGALSNGVAGYTPDNLAAAIQDSLICFEMPFFAITHWYAFSWHDYADSTISAARLPVKFALRDSFGIRDLIEDTKMTLRGENYEYRLFDSGDHIIPHAESNSRVRRVMHGMRYERGGKAKYWIPKPGEVNSRTPLLSGSEGSSRDRRSSTLSRFRSNSDIEEMGLDDEDERLFANARTLEFGDWNVSQAVWCSSPGHGWANCNQYPVITANEVPEDQRQIHHRSSPNLQNPGAVKRTRKHRKSRINNGGGTPRSEGSSRSSRREPPNGRQTVRQETSSSISHSSQRSQLVDLVVEDHKAEEAERVHTQKAFGSTWLEPDQRHFQYVAPSHRSHLSAAERNSTDLSFRRPSGEPVDERPSYLENSADGTMENTRAASPTDRAGDDEPTTRPNWTYGGLEEENVWDR